MKTFDQGRVKVSVVIPAHNEEKCIENALNALLDQNYHDYEVIVVDNASTDRTAQIVISISESDPRVRLVSEPRPGLLFARQRGLLEARGEIIAQLDADCIPGKNWIKKAVGSFDGPNVVAVAGPYDYHDAPLWFRGITLISAVLFRPMNFLVQKMGRGALMLGGNAFIRVSALTKTGGYNLEHGFYSEDLVTACQVAKVGEVKCFLGLMVKTSARRHMAVGFWKVQSAYNKGTLAVLLGKVIPNQPMESLHPR